MRLYIYLVRGITQLKILISWRFWRIKKKKDWVDKLYFFAVSRCREELFNLLFSVHMTLEHSCIPSILPYIYDIHFLFFCRALFVMLVRLTRTLCVWTFAWCRYITFFWLLYTQMHVTHSPYARKSCHIWRILTLLFDLFFYHIYIFLFFERLYLFPVERMHHWILRHVNSCLSLLKSNFFF